jgi:hypothetical protein
MATDLEIVKKIEKKLGIELKKVDKEGFKTKTRSYYTDDKNNIIGLRLHDLKISDISALKDLQKLTVLWLYDNQISDISALKDLQKLTVLTLWGNQITDISSLKDLQKLTYLDLMNNRLTTLPGWITELGLELEWGYPIKFEGIFLEGNPLESPPVEIVKEGTEAVRAYFKSLEGEKKALNEVKVLLVGDGGAGKTSLVKQLLDKAFDEEEPQTKGVNIDTLKVNKWGVGKGKDKIKVHLWDFGGQDIMHATHQFFLSKRSLYVLVLDSRKDEKTEYWLKNIESFGGDSPILVVINKTDENPSFDLNRPFLQNKYNGIKGFYRISCQTGDGIESFRKCLEKELAGVEHIKITWGVSWFNVKEKLEKMKDHFISYTDYKELCEDEEIKDQTDQDKLADFLHDLGVALHFKEFALVDTHVLDPKWATGAVYRIINSEKLAESRGLLRLTDLDEILAKREEGDYDYPHNRHPYIISLMKKFELCFELDSETVLIPDLLEVGEPKFDFDYSSALRFVISYDFLPRSVIPRFIVKMHSDIKDDLRWRTGCVLADKSFKSTAVIKADNDAKKIYIYVNGDKIKRKDYFTTILYFFKDINDSFEKLEVSERVPNPDNPKLTVSYNHLITLASKGMNDYVFEGSEEVYKVSDLLGIINIEQDKGEGVLNIVEKIGELTGKKIEDEKKIKESLFEKLNKIFIAKPTIRGFGIDINALISLIKELLVGEKKSR